MVSSADPETSEVSIVFWLLIHIPTLFLDIIAVLGVTNGAKNLEIIILRPQVSILQRKVKSPQRIPDPERIILATLTDNISHSIKDARNHLYQVCWSLSQTQSFAGIENWFVTNGPSDGGNPGRSKISSELEVLIVRLAKENPHWGYDKIQGEMLKLGHNLSLNSVRSVLKRHRITPASERSTRTWRCFLGEEPGTAGTWVFRGRQGLFSTCPELASSPGRLCLYGMLRVAARDDWKGGIYPAPWIQRKKKHYILTEDELGCAFAHN